MVGIPKSKGCDNCRKRKKKVSTDRIREENRNTDCSKCGREVPRCLACIKAGWNCSGYAKTWKFVNESERAAADVRSKKYILEDCSLVESDGLHDGQRNFERLESYWTESGAYNVGVFRILSTENDQNASVLNFILEDPDSQILFPLRSHGAHYNHIPRRLGRNIALDDSINCLCSIYFDRVKQIGVPSKTSMQRYVQSLSSLRACLEEAQLRTESETICATIILQLCEVSYSRLPGVEWRS
jgi:hypothetical protein